MTTIIDAIKMCEDKIKIHQNDTKNIEIAIGKNISLTQTSGLAKNTLQELPV